MAKDRTYNCELEVGDNTIYGDVTAVERMSDSTVRLEVKPLHGTNGPYQVFLRSTGTTNVRTGKDRL